MAYALGDDTGLSRPRTGNDQERPFAVGNGAALRVIQVQRAIQRRL
jgi:hypothetical protein